MKVLTDPFEKHKVITHMNDRMTRGETQKCNFGKIAPYLKGRTKTLRGFIYSPQFQSKKGADYAFYKDAVYQIINGTYYKCILKPLKDGKFFVIPRFNKSSDYPVKRIKDQYGHFISLNLKKPKSAPKKTES